jgi:hypothetical protein
LNQELKNILFPGLRTSFIHFLDMTTAPLTRKMDTTILAELRSWRKHAKSFPKVHLPKKFFLHTPQWYMINFIGFVLYLNYLIHLSNKEHVMNPRNKVWLTLFVFVLVAVTIACSCSSLTNTGGSGGSGSEPITGLAGKWRDVAENNVHTITWDGSKYVVTSVVDDTQGAYTIDSQSWDGSSLKWTYTAVEGASVTLWTTSVSGDTLNIGWSSSNGNSGTDSFPREP